MPINTKRIDLIATNAGVLKKKIPFLSLYSLLVSFFIFIIIREAGKQKNMKVVKLLLYSMTTIFVVAFLYINFVYAIVDQTTQQESFNNCTNDFGTNRYSLLNSCWNQHSEILLPIWLYLIPYLPAALLWGLRRSLNINLHLSVNAYPKRIVTGLVWLGLIAAAYGIILTFWIAIYLIEVPLFMIFLPTIVLSGWVIAPLLLQNLLAPVEAMRQMTALKIGLVLMFITPVLVFSFTFINTTIDSLLVTKSSLIS